MAGSRPKKMHGVKNRVNLLENWFDIPYFRYIQRKISNLFDYTCICNRNALGILKSTLRSNFQVSAIKPFRSRSSKEKTISSSLSKQENNNDNLLLLFVQVQKDAGYTTSKCCRHVKSKSSCICNTETTNQWESRFMFIIFVRFFMVSKITCCAFS